MVFVIQINIIHFLKLPIPCWPDKMFARSKENFLFPIYVEWLVDLQTKKVIKKCLI